MSPPGTVYKFRPNPGANIMSSSSELLRCYRESDLCVASFLCPCVVYGCNERYVDERNDMGFLCCLTGIICVPVCFSLPCTAWSRAKARSLVGLGDEPWIVDACASLFCPCCVIAQVARAIRAIGYDGREADLPIFSGGPPDVEDDMIR